MKRLIIIVFCISGIACKKNESVNYPLRATMKTSSGQTIQAKFLESETKFSKNSGPQGYDIVITGIKDGDEYALGLAIQNPHVGIQNLANIPGWNGSNCGAQIPAYIGTNYSSWSVGSGMITIESLTDSTIKGSFHAVCIHTNDTLRITDGSFNSKFN